MADSGKGQSVLGTLIKHLFLIFLFFILLSMVVYLVVMVFDPSGGSGSKTIFRGYLADRQAFGIISQGRFVPVHLVSRVGEAVAVFPDKNESVGYAAGVRRFECVSNSRIGIKWISADAVVKRDGRFFQLSRQYGRIMFFDPSGRFIRFRNYKSWEFLKRRGFSRTRVDDFQTFIDTLNGQFVIRRASDVNGQLVRDRCHVLTVFNRRGEVVLKNLRGSYSGLYYSRQERKIVFVRLRMTSLSDRYYQNRIQIFDNRGRLLRTFRPDLAFPGEKRLGGNDLFRFSENGRFFFHANERAVAVIDLQTLRMKRHPISTRNRNHRISAFYILNREVNVELGKGGKKEKISFDL